MGQNSGRLDFCLFLGSGPSSLRRKRPGRSAGSFLEQRLVIEPKVWPIFSFFGDDLRLADKISHPQVQGALMNISRKLIVNSKLGNRMSWVLSTLKPVG